MFGQLYLYEGQSRVLLHWQTGTHRCLSGFKIFLSITIYERQWYLNGIRVTIMVIYWWTQTKIRSLRWWFMFTEELPWRNAPKTCFLMKAFFIEVERFWFSSCLILRQSPCPSLLDPAHLLRLPHPPLASISIITVLAGISQITITLLKTNVYGFIYCQIWEFGADSTAQVQNPIGNRIFGRCDIHLPKCSHTMPVQ